MKEKTVRLGGVKRHIDIHITRAHSFTTDSVLLAAFSGCTERSKAVDMGAGCGIIAFLWALRGWDITALEISAEAAALMEHTRRDNNLGNVSVVRGDIRNIAELMPAGETMLAACNPPYFKTGGGRHGPNAERDRARSDGQCTLSDVAAAAQYLLHGEGRLCLCIPPGRMDDLCEALDENGLFLNRAREVREYASRTARLVLAEAVKLWPEKDTIWLPPLVARNDDGSESDEIKAIYAGFVDNCSNE